MTNKTVQMLTIGLSFFIGGLSTRVPGGGTNGGAHLERFSSVDEKSQIIVGELVFDRAKFISEGFGGFPVITSTDQ